MARDGIRARAKDKGARPRFGKAMILGGLLLFGTIFGAATLALRSGSIWPGEYSQGTFVFTNGYLSAGDRNQVVVVTSDRANNPLPGQQVVISFTNSTRHTLLTGKTNSKGILIADLVIPPQPQGEVVFTVESAGETVSRTMTVYNESSYAGPFATYDASGGSGSGAGGGSGETALPVKLYLSLDKPRYQPGQTMHLRTLCFREGAAVTENVTYEISDPSGNKLFRQVFPANKYGVTFFDYPLSEILPLGEYTISANTTTASSLKTVPVERYVLPKFSVSFTGLKSFYTLDDRITASLDVNYFFGKPVEGTARLTARLASQNYGWYFVSNPVSREILNTTVDISAGMGNFTIPAARGNVDSSSYSPWAQYSLELTAAVTDTAGHTETKTASVTLSPQSFYFTYIADTTTPGQPTTLTVVVRDPVGGPMPGMQVRLSEGNGQPAIATTDARGLATVRFTYEYQGSATLNVSGGSPPDTQTQSVYLGGPSAIKVVPDKRFYEVGETATVSVLADTDDDFSGVAGMALADVLVNGQAAIHKELALRDHQATFSFQVTKAMLPAFEIQAGKLSVMSYETYWKKYYGYAGSASYSNEFTDRYTMARDRISVGVGLQSELDVSVSASKASLKPGEEVELVFKTMNGTTPVSAALAVAIVDEALLSMGGGSAFEDIRQDLSQDPGYQQYSVYSYVWGPVGVKRAAPMFDDSGFYDYSPSDGILQYSSMNKVGDTVRAEPDTANVSRLSLAMAVIGVMGYFGVIGLGMMYRKTAVALLAGSLLLVAVVPFAMEATLKPKPVDYTDTSQQLSFNQSSTARSSYYPNYEMNEDWRGGVVPPFSPKPAAGGAGQAAGAGGSDGTSKSSFVAPSRAVTVRSWFPELWYWNPMVVTDESGRASIKLNAPDSITTWRIDTLASTADAKIGLGNGSLVVFQPFFVDPDLPVSAVRNDRFTFKVAIYNYEGSDRTVDVRLMGSSWFNVIGTDRVTAEVKANSVSSVQFTIQALKVGVQQLTVSGTTDTREDIVTRELRVEPDGQLVEDIRNGMLVNATTVELAFAQSGARIAGSENAYLKLQSSVESIIIDGAEGFINVVSGCGEQSTSGLAVDILAYTNYMKGRTDAKNLSMYKDIINKGIQHESQYLSTNTGGHGRAIVWHSGLGTGEDPDIWLTSWALQVYKDLRDAGFTVDDRIIPDLQTYLVHAQRTDGSWEFPDIGHWSINPELESYRVAATAYILRALVLSGMGPDDPAVRSGALFIEPLIGKYNESFTLALALDALELAGGSGTVTGPLVDKLLKAAQDEGNGAVSWKYGAPDDWVGRYHRGDNTIETTGYAVMALARANASADKVQGGAKYLVLSRTGGGYYGSTHNTAVAFTALNKLSDLTPLKSMTVEVLVGGAPAGTVTIDQSNKDLTFLTDLRQWIVSGDGPVGAKTVTVTLRSTGEGGVFYHLYTKQHIGWAQAVLEPAPDLALAVSYSSTNTTVGTQISATATVSYNGPATGLQMVLVDLRSPTGFALDETNFDDLQSRGVISYYEFRDSGRALVYLDSLRQGQTNKLEYTLTAMAPATSLLQHVNAFDMYNTTLSVELGPVEFSAV
jgi:hypothetical protein